MWKYGKGERENGQSCSFYLAETAAAHSVHQLALYGKFILQMLTGEESVFRYVTSRLLING